MNVPRGARERIADLLGDLGERARSRPCSISPAPTGGDANTAAKLELFDFTSDLTLAGVRRQRSLPSLAARGSVARWARLREVALGAFRAPRYFSAK